MSKYVIDGDTMTDIADAIRERNGSSTTYTPEQMVTVIGKLPNVYKSEDEGKVVQNGALAAQTSRTVIKNGTYDTTTNDAVIVSVSGGDSGKGGIFAGEIVPSSGRDGEVYLQYVTNTKSEPIEHTYVLTIFSALRETSPLNYAGATEIDLIFDDGNDGEASIKTMSGFSYSAITGNGNNSNPVRAFDGDLNNYWEATPMPITLIMTATVPAGYRPKTLMVMQRSADMYNNDVWKMFSLYDTYANVKYMIAGAEDMTTQDWEGEGNWTEFPCYALDNIVTNCYLYNNGAWDTINNEIVLNAILMTILEDKADISTKSIIENGTYRAADEGYRGYSEVAVNVSATRIFGRDNAGDDAVIMVQPVTREFTQHKLPSFIQAIILPTNPYEYYTDGQTIETNGMFVSAYVRSGNVYATVPISEITIEPTVADLSETTTRTTNYRLTRVTEFNAEPWPQTIVSVSDTATTYDATTGEAKNTWSVNGYIAFRSSAETGKINGGIMATDTSGVYGTVTRQSGQTQTYRMSDTYTYDGKTVYYRSGIEESNEVFPRSNAATIGIDSSLTDGRAAWIIVYGDSVQIGEQTISVSWPRPFDGEILETTFTIDVELPSS